MPIRSFERRISCDGRIDVTRLDGTTVGEVSFEVIRIDFDAADIPWNAQLQDDPVIARATATLGFPAVAHVFGAAGHEQVERRSVELIARGDRAASVFNCCEIDLPTCEALGARRDVTMNPQARDAAVGIDSQPQMSEAAELVDIESIS